MNIIQIYEYVLTNRFFLTRQIRLNNLEGAEGYSSICHSKGKIQSMPCESK